MVIALGLIRRPFIPDHWFIRHRTNKQIKAFVRGATAAAAGAIAGAVTVLARQAIPDWKTGLLVIQRSCGTYVARGRLVS